jgi:hypothetical protein
MNQEIAFIVEETVNGGYLARTAERPISAEAPTLPELHLRVRDAVASHFEPGVAPELIRLHFVREEVIEA